MAVYYKKIKGKNYDGNLINMAEASVKGKGDGRISLKDAKKILGTVKDSDDYTDIEKKTIKFIRDKYSFTPEANTWFRTEIRKWAATRQSIKKPLKKAARKPVKISRISKTKARKKPSKGDVFDEQYQREDTELLQKAGMEEKFDRTDVNKKKIFKSILVIVVILALAVVGLFLSPKTKDWMKKYLAIGGATIEKKTEKIIEEATPVKEEQKIAATDQKQKPPELLESNVEYYTVQVKDDLVSISEKLLNDYSKWKDLYEANRDIIKNPYVIYPGQKLKIPAKDRKK